MAAVRRGERNFADPCAGVGYTRTGHTIRDEQSKCEVCGVSHWSGPIHHALPPSMAFAHSSTLTRYHSVNKVCILITTVHPSMRCSPRITAAMTKAWCLLMHAEALSLVSLGFPLITIPLYSAACCRLTPEIGALFVTLVPRFFESIDRQKKYNITKSVLEYYAHPGPSSPAAPARRARAQVAMEEVRVARQAAVHCRAARRRPRGGSQGEGRGCQQRQQRHLLTDIFVRSPGERRS